MLLKESNLLSAALAFADGNIPSITNSLQLNTCLCISKSHCNILSHVSVNTINETILFIANGSLSIFSNIYFHIFMFLYLFLNTSHFSYIIPLAIYYISFIIMTVTSFHIFEIHKTYKHYTIWADLFHYHSDGLLDSEKNQHDFLAKNTAHQKMFFAAFIIHLALNPFIFKFWIPLAEIAILSLYLSITTFVNHVSTISHNSYTSSLMISSCILNVFARYPYINDSFMNKGWTKYKLDINNSANTILGSKLEFNLNCKAILYAIIPGILVILSKIKNWHGLYFYLLPHCITLSWLQLFILNAEFITLNGILRTAIIFMTITYFWRVCQLFGIILPLLAIDNFLNIQDITLKMSLAVGIITGIVLIKTKFATMKKISHNFTFKVQVIISSCKIYKLFYEILSY